MPTRSLLNAYAELGECLEEFVRREGQRKTGCRSPLSPRRYRICRTEKITRWAYLRAHLTAAQAPAKLKGIRIDPRTISVTNGSNRISVAPSAVTNFFQVPEALLAPTPTIPAAIANDATLITTRTIVANPTLAHRLVRPIGPRAGLFNGASPWHEYYDPQCRSGMQRRALTVAGWQQRVWVLGLACLGRKADQRLLTVRHI